MRAKRTRETRDTRRTHGRGAVRLKRGLGRGSSLLEVLVALSLLATSILGAASAQLAALRGAKAQIDRERASWVAASVAEAMRSPDTLSHALMRISAHAAVRLPGNRITVDDEPPGAGVVIVRWADVSGVSGVSGASAREQEPGLGTCPIAQGGTLARCVELPFASAT